MWFQKLNLPIRIKTSPKIFHKRNNIFLFRTDCRYIYQARPDKKSQKTLILAQRLLIKLITLKKCIFKFRHANLALIYASLNNFINLKCIYLIIYLISNNLSRYELLAKKTRKKEECSIFILACWFGGCKFVVSLGVLKSGIV